MEYYPELSEVDHLIKVTAISNPSGNAGPESSSLGLGDSLTISDFQIQHSHDNYAVWPRVAKWTTVVSKTALLTNGSA